jgi:hypothetical protein
VVSQIVEVKVAQPGAACVPSEYLANLLPAVRSSVRAREYPLRGACAPLQLFTEDLLRGAGVTYRSGAPRRAWRNASRNAQAASFGHAASSIVSLDRFREARASSITGNGTALGRTCVRRYSARAASFTRSRSTYSQRS